MEFRHLRYFVVVAEEHNFTRAAERLNITQPPLSQQIRDLESELGFELFDRSRRHLELTAKGKLFLERAYTILEQVDQAREDAKKIDHGEIGRLVVGYINFAFYTPLLEILKIFRLRYPQVELVLRELLTAEQLEALPNYEIDIGFVILPIVEEGLSVEPISRERFIVALPENHRLANKPALNLEELVNEDFVMHPQKIKSVFYNQIIGMCHGAGFTPKVSQEVIQIHSVINMVAAGIGIAFVPSCIKNSGRPGVIYKEIHQAATHLSLGLSWRKGDTSPVLQNFLMVVKEVKEKGTPLRESQIDTQSNLFS